MSRNLKGLYAVTRPAPGGAGALAEAVLAALRGGARLVQYRDKSGDGERRRAEASALLRACREYDAPLIVNDDVALAAEIGADGVHLGAGDMDPVRARAHLGSRALVGVSCYDDLDRAIEAQARGADYVAFGSFFPSPTKPGAVRAEPALLTRAREALRVPICAIGGIRPDNGAMLVRAGADMLAVISGVFGAPDPGRAAAEYARLFEARQVEDSQR